MSNYVTKDVALRHMKEVVEVCEQQLGEKEKISFNCGFQIMSHGGLSDKSNAIASMKAILEYLEKAPKTMLFQPGMMIQSADVAGAKVQAELDRKQKAKDSIIKPGQK